jgi:3-dehydroquinate synthase
MGLGGHKYARERFLRGRGRVVRGFPGAINPEKGAGNVCVGPNAAPFLSPLPHVFLARFLSVMISESISLSWSHRIFFTEDLFSPSNQTLEEVLSLGLAGRKQRPRVMLVLDEGLADANANLTPNAEAWFHNRREKFELRLQPILCPGGEGCKNDPKLLGELWQAIHDAGLDRHSYVVVIGGGAVLDLVGFAAATAHRGIRLVRVPTTSLSQGDGGVGVKNGINFFGKKNWLGSFAVPHAVINDGKFLDSLPTQAKRDGYIEAVKVALIRDGSFYEEIERRTADLNAFEPTAMRWIIERSAALHVRHIAKGGDPFELGSARPLDFGHWIAHKLEQLTQYQVTHGQAVAIGMAADLLYAQLTYQLEAETCARILRLITALGFDVWHEALLSETEEGDLAILRGLEEFREHLGGDLCITLVTDIGKAHEVNQMDGLKVAQALHALAAVQRELLEPA